jgi:hypothetical protein
MFKDTCLVALKRKDQSPHMFVHENIVYLILKSSFIGFEMTSPNAQLNNHTNATIIRI